MKRLRWVVQKDLWNEKGYRQLLDALEGRGIPHDVVTVRPFIHDFRPEIRPEGPTIVMGWEGFGIRARALGWRPGAYLSTNLDQRIWMTEWGSRCLNSDSVIGRLADVPTDRGQIFIRPVLDDKSFAGRLDTPETLASWKEDLAAVVAGMEEGESLPTVTLDTTVAWASPKTILAEWRFFVVGGVVVTGSRYQRNGRSSHARMTRPDIESPQWSSTLEPDPWTFAQEAAEWWSPLPNFVIDVADTPDGLRIIECGCLNAAGWYDSDVAALVDAIEAYERGRVHAPFQKGDAVHHVTGSGVVNGIYHERMLTDLHVYHDLEGRRCAGPAAGDRAEGIHPGHDPGGASAWFENDL